MKVKELINILEEMCETKQSRAETELVIYDRKDDVFYKVTNIDWMDEDIEIMTEVTENS